MSRMCVSIIRFILLLKDASGTNIYFLYGRRLENISLVCADVKTFCTLQQRGGVLSVLLHNRLVPNTLTDYNCFKNVVSLLNSLNG